MDRNALAMVAAQLQQVVSSLQSLGGMEDFGMSVTQPLPTWATVDARVPARPYQPLVSREKHVIDLAAELAPSQNAPIGLGLDEYGMPKEEDMGAAYTAMGVM